MRIVIVGASRFGTATAEELIDSGHEVVLVDPDRARLEELQDELDCGFLHGDGSLPSIQREAYGDHADALVLLTNEDDVNILAAMVGRSIGFERVVPQIVRPELLAVCEELGLENLITPHATVARSIVRVLESHDDATLSLRLHKGAHLAQFTVPARLDGCTIAELDLPDRARAIALTRGEEEELVSQETRLAEGDNLVVALADDIQDEVSDYFAAPGESDANGR